MAELPRQSHILQGKPLEYTPSQLEGLRALVLPTENRIRSTEVGESSIIFHPDYQLQTTELIQEPISVSEVNGSISPSSELAKEPGIF